MLCRPLPVNTSCSAEGDQAPCDRYAAATLSDRRCSDAGPLPQRGIERRKFVQAIQAVCDQRGLIGKHRVVELEVDPDAAWLTWRRNAAPSIARDEGAPPYFADDKPAAQ